MRSVYLIWTAFPDFQKVYKVPYDPDLDEIAGFFYQATDEEDSKKVSSFLRISNKLDTCWKNFELKDLWNIKLDAEGNDSIILSGFHC